MKNPNELSATSSWRGNELQLIEQKANIVVGVANSRTRLRIGVLLSKYSEYQVDYISSESETGKLIEEADLIIGAGLLPMKGGRRTVCAEKQSIDEKRKIDAKTTGYLCF